MTIYATESSISMNDWRKMQRESFSRVADVADFLKLSPTLRNSLLEKPPFPFLVPRRLAEKIVKESLSCPIAQQFLPMKEELVRTQGFVPDPTCDAAFQKSPRLLHKYQGRILIIGSGACAMNCRFCFRQNFAYPENREPFTQELDYIRNDPSIDEVILSGGDPFSLSDERLEAFLQAIDTIPHVKLIRFHTRFFIGIPERATPALIALLQRVKKQLVLIIHTNHIAEFDDEIFAALRSLPCLLLSQSVLLRGINDSVAALKHLFLGLASHGIIPYYLHQLDPVEGANHFQVPIETGRTLIEALRAELPGYALPRYVQEVPHRPSKTPL